VKLKLIFVCLAVASVQITPLNAQSVSPEGRYTRTIKAGGRGDMRVEKTGEGWRVFIRAAGSEIAKERAAGECMLIAEGEIKGNTFQGEIKYTPDTWDTWDKPSPADAAEPGKKITITFTPQSATPSPVGAEAQVCGRFTTMWDRYTKRK
jgi:hypothetical protein